MNVRLLHITTVPMSLTFLRGQVGYMRHRGLQVHVISSPGPELQEFLDREGITGKAIEMSRRITPIRDVVALLAVVREFRRVRPTIVHAHTPKGGLLGMIAAWLCGVPVRIYHLRGLPMTGARWWRRGLLKGTDWVACHLAHQVICVSESLREQATASKVCPAGRIEVLCGGSGNGVDAAQRFNPSLLGNDTRESMRERLGIPAGATVIGYVGRIVRDKGVTELVQAWRELADHHADLHLLMVGPFEAQDPVPEETADLLRTDPRVHLAGMDWNTPPLYRAMDLVALPSYREGFPNVPLEAAAMALPVVATRIPGCIDAVVNGVTGTLVPAHAFAPLRDALETYVRNPELRRAHGQQGRARVLREFRPEAIWQKILEEYERLLSVPVPARRTYRIVKRSVDFSSALLGLLLLSPVMLLTALAILAVQGGPVWFRQTRPGLHGRPFTLVKFSTMRVAFDARGDPLPDEERLTRLGRFLRAASLDELPQLWNVLRGEMSLVGPRPLLMEYLALYNAEQARRHEVLPGITGWAQINGRNRLGWEERLRLDVWYVDHRSLSLDLRILLSTARRIFTGDGVSQPGRATMEKFSGTG